jgi:hypothetical protein
MLDAFGPMEMFAAVNIVLAVSDRKGVRTRRLVQDVAPN